MSDSFKQNPPSSSKRDALLAALLPVALLLPFINKAIHIDDTVYILVAQQIVQSPFDYFGFQMNWTGELTWVYDFNKNPPGLSYYLAAWGMLFGWSEIAMHTAMLIPTALASLGIYRLAERLCGRPLLATFLAVCTPGFLVSCSNVMCEPPMLACYVWALVWWMRGMDSGNKRRLAAGAILIGVGALVKFVAFTALPLLVAYTLWRERRVGWRLLWFLVPITMLVLYDIASWALYDKGFIRDIIQYSAFHTSHSSRGPVVTTSLITLAFVGGLYLPSLGFALWSESRKVLIGVAVGTGAFVLLLFMNAGIDDTYAMYGKHGVLWGFLAQQVVFTVAGVYTFVLGAMQFRKKPGAESALLCLLICGIFVFGGFVNWTINARALLPMAPAIAIVAVQRIESLGSIRFGRVAEVSLGVCATIFALAVCLGDYQFANTSRTFAAELREELEAHTADVWYDGHLGFQWYMHEDGYHALDFASASKAEGEDKMFNTARIVLEPVPPGDIVVVWDNNALITEVPEERIDSAREFTLPGPAWISIYDGPTRTGFYGRSEALLPFRLGDSTPQHFTVYRLK